MWRSYKELTGFEVGRAIKFLSEFRNLIIGYSSKTQPVSLGGVLLEVRETEESYPLRIAIDMRLERAKEIIRKTPIPAWREIFDNYREVRYPVNLLDYIPMEKARELNPANPKSVTREIVDIIQQVIGVYENGTTAAWIRTFNPFFWITFLFEWLAYMFIIKPVAFVFGRNAIEVRKNRFGRVVSRFFEVTGWLATIILFGDWLIKKFPWIWEIFHK